MKICTRVCTSRALHASLAWLCVLFSCYLSAQSFADKSQVFISKGTIVSETSPKQKIFVVKDTVIKAMYSLDIAYLVDTSVKKNFLRSKFKPTSQRVLAKEDPKSSYLHQIKYTFVLKPLTPRKLLWALNNSVHNTDQLYTNHYYQNLIITVDPLNLVFHKSSV